MIVKARHVWYGAIAGLLVQLLVVQATAESAAAISVNDQKAPRHALQDARLRGLIGGSGSGSSSIISLSSSSEEEEEEEKNKKKARDLHQWYDDIQIHGIPPLVTHLGLHLKDPAAERAFFAKDYAAVSYSDFRALWGRCEEAKRDEQKLMRDHASDHTILCNKVLKVGAEAVMFSIFGDSASAHEHLLKFRKNIPLVGHTCKDAGLG